MTHQGEKSESDPAVPPTSAWVLNLTFHGVGETERVLTKAEASFWASEQSFDTIVRAVRGRTEFRLTFDDANESDVTKVLPILLREGLHGTFFVPVGLLRRPGYMTVEGVRTLVDAGMTIGSHGMHHRRWRGLAAEELDEELAAARDRLEDVAGGPIRQAACPFGVYDRRVLTRLRALGYNRVFTSDGGRARCDDWLQPRNSVRAGDGADLIDHLLIEPSLITRVARGSRSTMKKYR